MHAQKKGQGFLRVWDHRIAGCKLKEGSDSVFFFFSSFIFISWRLITLQYCSGFFHTLT